MNTNIIDDYKRAIRVQFEEAKNNEYSSFLFKPSPAELKILCLLLFDRGLSKHDQEIFNAFFRLDDNSQKRKQIENFSVDKLKPIGNFLKGKTKTTRIVCLDLIAVLVNLRPRPYRKFFANKKNEITIDSAEVAIFRGKKEE